MILSKKGPPDLKVHKPLPTHEPEHLIFTRLQKQSRNLYLHFTDVETEAGVQGLVHKQVSEAELGSAGHLGRQLMLACVDRGD